MEDQAGLLVCLSVIQVWWCLGCLVIMTGGMGALVWFLNGYVDRRDVPLWLQLRGFAPTPPSELPLGEVAAAPGEVLYLSEDQRHTHQLLLGASGAGKSKALAGWVAHDVAAGHGVILIDPHEGLVRDVLALAGDRMKDPVILSAGDPNWAIGYNPLQPRPRMSAYQTAAALLDVFQKVWVDDWGVWMHDYLLHTFWALSLTGWTMLEAPRFLIDPSFRGVIARELRGCAEDVGPLLDWITEYDAKTPGQQKQERQSTMVRLRQFVSDPHIRVILGQRQGGLDFDRIIRERIPFLISLSWRELKINAYLLGALILSQLQDAVLSGPTIDQVPRPATYFVVDEFQEMATRSFVQVLAQARKYGLSVVVATQNLESLGSELEAAVLTNCHNLCVFSCNHVDAVKMAHELFVDLDNQPIGVNSSGKVAYAGAFQPKEREYIANIQGQRPRYFWMRRKGQSKALQLKSVAVELPREMDDMVKALVDRSGYTYGRKRSEVEQEVIGRHKQLAGLVKNAGYGALGSKVTDDPDALEIGNESA